VRTPPRGWLRRRRARTVSRRRITSSQTTGRLKTSIRKRIESGPNCSLSAIQPSD